jgi:membrane fusion protein, multidrug efflux system
MRLLVLVTLTALAAACGRESDAAQPAAGGGPGGRPGGGRGGPPAVETAAVTLGSIARELEVTGSVEPLRSVGVNAQVGGALISVGVEEGSFVRQGQVLARLDDREVAAQAASARANWEVARDALARARQLRERQVITEAEYERDRAAEAAARAALDGVRTRQGYTVIRSPLSGVVIEKQVEAGDVIGAQNRLFSIADLSTLVVRVGVSELEIASLSPGQSVRVMFDAHPGQRFEGRVRRIFPAADAGTRLVPVEVALTGDGARAARPGYLARIGFALGARDGVLLVPASAIIGAAGAQNVYVVRNGRAERRRVETGLSSEGRVEIVSGLAEGDPVVVTGASTLRNDVEVRVVAGPGAGESRPEQPQGGGR